MKERPKLNRDQQIQLIRAFTNEEVFQALEGIDTLKAPGCDGFNSFFFLKTRHILGDEVINEVLSFFEAADMYGPINCTSVTLIPKVKHPATIKEYRPICCTTLY